MKKTIHKLLLCLTAFTFVFSTFGGSVALAATSYYKSGKSITTSAGVKIHENNFPAKATVITYTMLVNGKEVGVRDIKKKTGLFSSFAEDSITMYTGEKNVKEQNNSVTVKACYRDGSNYKEYNCKQATVTGLTGKQVDTKTFKLNVDKTGKATLKY